MYSYKFISDQHYHLIDPDWMEFLPFFEILFSHGAIHHILSGFDSPFDEYSNADLYSNIYGLYAYDKWNIQNIKTTNMDMNLVRTYRYTVKLTDYREHDSYFYFTSLDNLGAKYQNPKEDKMVKKWLR